MDVRLKKSLSLAGMFYRRRDEWIRHVIRMRRVDPKRDLSSVEKLVAVYIAETLNPKSQSWIISQARIAADLEVDEKSVKNAVMKLRRMGLLETRRVKVEGNAKRFNAYSIVSPEHAEPPQGECGFPYNNGRINNGTCYL